MLLVQDPTWRTIALISCLHTLLFVAHWGRCSWKVGRAGCKLRTEGEGGEGRGMGIPGSGAANARKLGTVGGEVSSSVWPGSKDESGSDGGWNGKDKWKSGMSGWQEGKWASATGQALFASIANNVIALWSESKLCIISILFKVLRLFHGWAHGLPERIIHVPLRVHIPKLLVSLVGLQCCLSFLFPCQSSI